METAQAFIERYLREKREILEVSRKSSMSLQQKFFGEDYLKFLRDCQDAQWYTPEVFESADVSDTRAKIITCWQITKTRQRRRYHLAFAAETWKIINEEQECLLCNGTGQKNGVVCPICKGEVWCQIYKTR